MSLVMTQDTCGQHCWGSRATHILACYILLVIYFLGMVLFALKLLECSVSRSKTQRAGDYRALCQDSSPSVCCLRDDFAWVFIPMAYVANVINVPGFIMDVWALIDYRGKGNESSVWGCL